LVWRTLTVASVTAALTPITIEAGQWLLGCARKLAGFAFNRL
jgi:hypothetical protein